MEHGFLLLFLDIDCVVKNKVMLYNSDTRIMLEYEYKTASEHDKLNKFLFFHRYKTASEHDKLNKFLFFHSYFFFISLFFVYFCPQNIKPFL